MSLLVATPDRDSIVLFTRAYFYVLLIFASFFRHDHLTHLPTDTCCSSRQRCGRRCLVTSCLYDLHSSCPEKGEEHCDSDGATDVHSRVRCGQNTATATTHRSCLPGNELAAAFTSVTPIRPCWYPVQKLWKHRIADRSSSALQNVQFLRTRKVLRSKCHPDQRTWVGKTNSSFLM